MKKSHQAEPVDVACLGQAGFCFGFESATVYIDPYLSNSVEESEGPELRRLVPIWKEPQFIRDADWVLITHIHMDHCDVDTLIPLSRASSRCRFMGPRDVGDVLVAHGLEASRFVFSEFRWHELGNDLRVHPLPAAHPSIEYDAVGGFRYIGYIIECKGRRIYHSGDTLLNADVIKAVQEFTPIDVAFLPVNERNHYRDARGIVGNMSIRDAFQFAIDLGVSTVVPIHWDMFAPNSVYREEIEAYYRLSQPPFRMLLNPIKI